MARLLVITFSIVALATACGGEGDGNGGGGNGNGTATPSVVDLLANNLYVPTHSYPGWISGCTDCTEFGTQRLTGPTAGVYRYETRVWIHTAEATSTYTAGEAFCVLDADFVATEVAGYLPEERMVAELTNFDDTCYGIGNGDTLTVVLGSTVPDASGESFLFQYFLFDPALPTDPADDWACANGGAETLKLCAAGDGMDPTCAPVGPADGVTACDIPDAIEH